MADISGPVSTLPGSRRTVPAGMLCDTEACHTAGVLATVRIQGETDSFGAEYEDLCDACVAKLEAEVEAARNTPGTCDWCKRTAILVNRRDPDEGMAGPVYRVCHACIAKSNQQDLDSMEEAEFDTWEAAFPDPHPAWDAAVQSLNDLRNADQKYSSSADVLTMSDETLTLLYRQRKADADRFIASEFGSTRNVHGKLYTVYGKEYTAMDDGTYTTQVDGKTVVFRTPLMLALWIIQRHW